MIRGTGTDFDRRLLECPAQIGRRTWAHPGKEFQGNRRRWVDAQPAQPRTDRTTDGLVLCSDVEFQGVICRGKNKRARNSHYEPLALAVSESIRLQLFAPATPAARLQGDINQGRLFFESRLYERFLLSLHVLSCVVYRRGCKLRAGPCRLLYERYTLIISHFL